MEDQSIYFILVNQHKNMYKILKQVKKQIPFSALRGFKGSKPKQSTSPTSFQAINIDIFLHFILYSYKTRVYPPDTRDFSKIRYHSE